MPPPAPLDARGMRLLASLTAWVIVWGFNAFDEFIVAILLLLFWVVAGVVPPGMAVAGFSGTAWFFFLGALSISAAVTKSGLLIAWRSRCCAPAAPSHHLPRNK